MRIVINAYNLIIGGGLTVGLGIVESLFKLETKDEIHIFIPENENYNFISAQNIVIHHIPKLLTRFITGRIFVNFYLKYKVEQINPDRIFSLGNYAIPTNRRQLLMLQWPYAVYPDSIVWDRMSFWSFIKRRIRLLIVRKNLKYTTALTVQTNVMKERAERYLNFKKPIYIVESSYINEHKKNPFKGFEPLTNNDHSKFILCVSEYYTHKNLEILVPLAELIKKKGSKYKILLTIDEKKSNLAGGLIRKIKMKGLGDILINLGRIGRRDIPLLYKQSHGLILPTLLESYGLIYLEATSFQLPIFTSDLDFARAINGSNAYYFNPLSHHDIYESLEDAFDKPDEMKEKVVNAFKNLSEIRNWQDITREYIRIVKDL